MSRNPKTVAEKILHLLKGYGFTVTSMDKDGEVTADIKNATRFYVDDPNVFVRLSIPDNSINLKTSEDLNNHLVRTQLRRLARDYLMAFNYEVYEKPVVPKGEETDIEKNKEQDMADAMSEMLALAGLEPLSENEVIAEAAVCDKCGKENCPCPPDECTCTEEVNESGSPDPCTACGGEGKDEDGNGCHLCGGTGDGRSSVDEESIDVVAESSFSPMSGSSKSSYQGLDQVKIVVRHNKPVNEEVRGSRSRNIHSIYIQRGDERFKMQENNLMAARAMARHINNGGQMYDSVGSQITQLAEEFKSLREFVSYVRRSKIVNETNEEYVSLAKESLGNIKNMFGLISKNKGYSSGINEMNEYFASSKVEVLEDDVDLESKFTETHFDDRVANAIDSIKGAMTRQQAYQKQITMAAESETFEGMADMLQESGVLEFSDPRSQLATQITQMGASAENQQLGTFLQGLGQRVGAGGSLNQFEYSTLKSCLMSASQPRIKESTQDNVLENFENILNKYAIY